MLGAVVSPSKSLRTWCAEWGGSGMALGFRIQDLAVSQNKGTPIWTPIYYNPYYRDPQKGTPNFGKPPFRDVAIAYVLAGDCNERGTMILARILYGAGLPMCAANRSKKSPKLNSNNKNRNGNNNNKKTIITIAIVIGVITVVIILVSSILQTCGCETCGCCSLYSCFWPP